jgi:hypothetical protein
MACLYPKVAIILPTTPHLTFKTRALSKPPLRFLTGDSRPGACSSPSKALSGYGSEENRHRLQVQDEPRSAQGIEEDRGGIQWSREELGSRDHGVVTRAVSPDRLRMVRSKRDRGLLRQKTNAMCRPSQPYWRSPHHNASYCGQELEIGAKCETVAWCSHTRQPRPRQRPPQANDAARSLF